MLNVNNQDEAKRLPFSNTRLLIAFDKSKIVDVQCLSLVFNALHIKK